MKILLIKSLKTEISLGEKQFIDKFVEDVDSEDNEYYDNDYNYDYNYYTVENVPQSELEKYTSTSTTKRMRKKVSKEPKELKQSKTPAQNIDSEHIQGASKDTVKLKNDVKISNTANNKILLSIASFKNIQTIFFVFYIRFFIL